MEQIRAPTPEKTRTTLVNGGAMRDRTADLLDANQALSQLSYGPFTYIFANEVKVTSIKLTQPSEPASPLKQQIK